MSGTPMATAPGSPEPQPDASRPAPTAEVVIVSGTSGSGKSVALHALEDAGFYCVDNLPPELLRDFLNSNVHGSTGASR